MKFTTPCFVRVEDAEKRKELIEWLYSIGYENDANSADINDDRTQIVAVSMIESGFYHGNIYLPQYWVDINSGIYRYFTNCGTNIDLFKALAAMNDENDREQWFVGMYESDYNTWHLNHHKHLQIFCKNGVQLRKATAEEIIEHFK